MTQHFDLRAAQTTSGVVGWGKAESWLARMRSPIGHVWSSVKDRSRSVEGEEPLASAEKDGKSDKSQYQIDTVRHLYTLIKVKRQNIKWSQL